MKTLLVRLIAAYGLFLRVIYNLITVSFKLHPTGRPWNEFEADVTGSFDGVLIDPRQEHFSGNLSDT